MKKTRITSQTVFPFILLAVLVAVWVGGCASGPADESGGGTLRFTLQVAESGGIDISGHGYYAILLNSRSEAIEVTNFETFTDFIRYDGINFRWYHRQGNVPSPGYTWVDAGGLNSNSFISSDGNSLVVRMNLSDSSFIFNQYIESRRFTAHVVTTDRSNSLLGRAVDTLGQGPSISGNSLYTVFFDSVTGLLSPAPPGYPGDPVGDYDQKPDLENFPYPSYDIESFSLEIE